MTLNTQRPSQAKEKLLQAVTVQDSNKKKRLNADIEAELYKRIKARALEEERSVSDITRELWIEYLSNYSNTQ